MLLRKLHHVAYRCRDAQETVDFYTQRLGLKFAKAIVQERVPSIRKEDPHTHIFFEMADGSYIAFFDLLSDGRAIPEGQRDWAQHIALEVAGMDELLAAKARLEEAGVETVGPVDHGMCQSIYFYDPSGHRLELAVRTESAEAMAAAAAEAYATLDSWNARKRQDAR